MELVLTCAACGDDRELLRVGLETFDASDRTIYWRATGVAADRLQFDGPEGRKLFVYCDRGHDLQRLTDGLERRLAEMWAPRRHAVARLAI